MRCDGLRLLSRAAWKHLPNRFGHSHRETLILSIAIGLGPLAPDTALLSIGGALCPGLLQCRFFDQHSLAFVALASPAKANHHGGKCAVLPSTSGQSGIASGQVNQMVEIGTCEAKWSFALHKEEIAPQQLLSAIGALRLPEDVEHNEVLRF
jgi:hypothetical protein